MSEPPNSNKRIIKLTGPKSDNPSDKINDKKSAVLKRPLPPVDLTDSSDALASSDNLSVDILAQPEKRARNLHVEINTIEDLIKFEENDAYEYYDNVDCLILYKLKPILIKLNKMVGMTKIKKDIISLILYYLQSMDKNANGVVSNDDFLNTAIYGPPGTGKTTVARIIGEIYATFGFLKEGKFNIAKRTEFIGAYLGQTAHITKKKLESCLGGVMLIDEAYSFGSGNKDHDTYTKEALDTLNEFLSEHKREFVCIVAGYKEDVESVFFASNQGLNRRFVWRFTIDEYTPKELQEIFIQMVTTADWSFLESADKVIPVEWINEHKGEFTFAGGDMEILFAKCKIVHTKRTFGMSKDFLKKLNNTDILKAFDLFKEHKSSNKEYTAPYGMYT